MYPLAGPLRLRLLPRLSCARTFHSPFVVLNATNPLATPPPSTATPMYEKQDDSSPEPHLSSSGTRTYVVSEPDPSNTPYQVPSGAYPASAPYLTTSPHNTRAVIDNKAGVGQSAAVKNTAVSGEVCRRAGEIGNTGAASSKPGKF